MGMGNAMIRLEANNLLVRWFVWCCDHLIITVGTYRDDDGKKQRRTGAYYVQNGTTLCHVFWASLWFPLILVAFAGFALSMITMMHVEMHYEFVANHPYANPALQFASYFVPEGFLLIFAAVVLVIILTVIGGSKSGFFSLLWQYLKGIKSRVCPLVKFEGGTMTAGEMQTNKLS